MNTVNRYTQFPILVSAATVDDLLNVFDAVKRIVADQIVSTSTVSTEILNAVKAGEVVDPVEGFKATGVLRTLELYATPEIELHFVDGMMIHHTSYDEARVALRTRSSPVSQINITVGKSDYLRLFVKLEDSILGTAQVRANGELALARTAFEDAFSVLENHEAPYAWLRKGRNQIIIDIILFTSTVLVYWITINHTYLPRKSIAMTLASNSLFPFIIFAFAGSTYITTRIIKLFPRIEFEFGRSSLRRKSARVTVLQILALLGSPALFALISVWASSI